MPIAGGGFQSARPMLLALRPLGSFFVRRIAIVEACFILITNGDFHRVPQFCGDFVEV
jgi:hypothetical protein